MVKLNNWSIVAHTKNRVGLRGEVVGHPTIKDGEIAHTSTMLYFNSKDMKANTLNTEYELGSICKSFESWLVEKGHNLSDYDGEVGRDLP